jgi:hypothetical protein
MRSLINCLLLFAFLSACPALAQEWQVAQRPKDQMENYLVGNPAVIPGDDKLYFLSEAGVYFSTNFGGSWSLLTVELADKQITRLYRTASNTMIATLGGNEGIRISANESPNWVDIVTLAGMPVQEIVEHPNKTLVAAVRGPVAMRSIDGGLTWEPSISGLPEDHWGQAIIKLSNNDILLSTGFNGEYGLYRSTDAGITWKKIEGTLPSYYIHSFAQGQNGDIYAGTREHGVYRSQDNGASWEAMNLGLHSETEEVESIAIANDGSIFIGTEGRGIFRWRNDGPWQSAGEGEGDYINRIAVDRSGYVYAGSDRGLVVSTFSTGFNSVSSHAASVQFAIFPNPSEERLSIRGEFASAHFEIIDAGGRIAMRGMTSGSESIDIRDLAQGIYQLRIGELGITSFVKR